MSIFKVSEKIDKTTNIVANITAVLSLILVFLIVYDAFNRYLFSEGSIAVQELEWHIFDVIILLSLSYTFLQNGHVKVDIIYHNLNEKYKNYIDVIAYLFFVIPFSILVICASIDFVILSYEQNETSPNPAGLELRFLIKSVIILGFSFVIMQVISEILKKIQRIKMKD